MCGEQHNDIPIRTLVTQSSEGWKAHCLDFDLVGHGPDANEAVERLEEEIVRHLQEVKSSGQSLFRPVGPEVWREYYETAEVMLNQTGPGHAHIEHRPLLAGFVLRQPS